MFSVAPSNTAEHPQYRTSKGASPKIVTLSPPGFGEESLALPFFAGAVALVVALVFAIALGVRSRGGYAAAASAAG